MRCKGGQRGHFAVEGAGGYWCGVVCVDVEFVWVWVGGDEWVMERGRFNLTF